MFNIIYTHSMVYIIYIYIYAYMYCVCICLFVRPSVCLFLYRSTFRMWIWLWTCGWSSNNKWGIQKQQKLHLSPGMAVLAEWKWFMVRSLILLFHAYLGRRFPLTSLLWKAMMLEADVVPLAGGKKWVKPMERSGIWSWLRVAFRGMMASPWLAVWLQHITAIVRFVSYKISQPDGNQTKPSFLSHRWHLDINPSLG